MAGHAEALARTVASTVARHGLFAPGERVVVAVSGGADSLVLLDVLRARPDLRLHVATLDHGIRGAAGAADADFVCGMAQAWGLPVRVGRADVPAVAAAHHMSLEEAARQVRYVFLRRVACHTGAARIATGHHQDDQAETVLMHLIRGSGLDGLRGMLPVTPLDDYHLPPDVTITCDPPLPEHPPEGTASGPLLVRPLLDVPRAAIDAYAAVHDLHPRQDATNQDITYFRNRLRHVVLPQLAQLNPNIRATLARTAEVLRADAEVVHRAAEAALARVLRAERADGVILDRGAWCDELTLSEQRASLRVLTYRLRPALRDVALEHVDNAIRIACAGDVGAAATLPGGLLLRVGHGVLRLGGAEADLPLVVPGADAPALDGPTGPTFTPGAAVTIPVAGWAFEAGPAPEDGRAVYALHDDPLAAALAVPPGVWLRLRTRQPGDRFLPRGMGGHSKKLSDLFNAMKIPLSWRDRVPLLVAGDQIAWFVAPVLPEGTLRGRVAAPFGVTDDRPATMRVVWRPV
jgi:tRNA(Ile)-lysidine synthase